MAFLGHFTPVQLLPVMLVEQQKKEHLIVSGDVPSLTRFRDSHPLAKTRRSHHLAGVQ